MYHLKDGPQRALGAADAGVEPQMTSTLFRVVPLMQLRYIPDLPMLRWYMFDALPEKPQKFIWRSARHITAP